MALIVTLPTKQIVTLRGIFSLVVFLAVSFLQCLKIVTVKRQALYNKSLNQRCKSGYKLYICLTEKITYYRICGPKKYYKSTYLS